LTAGLLSPVAALAQPSLKNPASLNEKAPATYKVRLDTSAGPVVIEVTRDWAPLGADRFYNLVKNGFYDDVRFFRVIPGFMAQGGMNGDPAIQKLWGRNNFNDDPVKQSNTRGMVTFAKTGAPNSRSTQIFINYGNNARLDADGFAPFGRVTSGMEAVDKFEAYKNVPDQGLITAEGNAYLQRDYPKLTVIKKATIEK
jgi:peptidyl-prolyl cis-trans isomerase A (cyclophilin A)